LVLPFRNNSGDSYEYAIFKRSDAGYWQGIAGGGEDNETPSEAAERELFEEAGIKKSTNFIPLQFMAYVPAIEFKDHKYWSSDLFVIPEYYFSLDINDEEIKISKEHSEYKWVDYETAYNMLHWQTNKIGLWEVNERLKKLLAV
jgi:dATP pyrophosphohydrolase